MADRKKVQRSGLIAAAAILAVALVFVVLYSRPGGGPTGARPDGVDVASTQGPGRHGVGAGVVVSGEAPADLHAVVAAGVGPSFELADPASRAFSLRPSGPLPAPVIIRLPLDREVAADGRTLVYTSEARHGPWSPLPTTITHDGGHAEVRVTHLSYFQALTTDIDGVLAELQEFFNGLTSGIVAEARPPTCGGTTAARDNGYLVTAAGKDAIYWCLGLQGGKPILKVVNNRRYPLLASHPRLSVARGGSGGTLAQHIARLLSFGGVVIYPRDEVDFGADLAAGATGNMEVNVGQQAQLLSSLDVGVKALLTILTKFGAAEDPNTALKVLDTLLTADTCRTSRNSGEMLANCLNAKQLIAGFGPVLGLILAPIITVSGVVDYFHGAINGFLDQFSNRSWAKVVVRRQAMVPFTQFVGTWTVHGAQLLIKADRTGQMQWNRGPCLTALTSPPPPMCRGNATIKFTSTADGVTGSYVRVWYTTWSGARPPAGFVPGHDITEDDVFALRKVATGLLKERIVKSQTLPDDILGNPYWCGADISASHQRLCGA
jgi:hypothetical protein